MDQILQHYYTHDLLPDHQSAYRKYFSCKTLLLKLTNDICINLDKGLITSMVMLDLSAAFDTIDV